MYAAAMNRRLPSLSALRAFEAAARHLSFKQAAQELSVTATAVSHQIRALEQELGLTLFVRKTRAVALTPQGAELHVEIRGSFERMAAAIDRIREPERRVITLTTTPAFASKWLVPRISRFASAHPGIDLHVHASNEAVDLHTGAVDLAVRYGQGGDPRLHETLLWQDHFAPVASRRLPLRCAMDLARMPLIHVDFLWRPLSFLCWETWAQAAGVQGMDTAAGVRYSDESHAIQAVVAGQGVALLSLALVRSELDMGLLQAPIGPVLDGLAYRLVRPLSRPASAGVAAVERWLQDEALSDRPASRPAP